MFFENPLLNVDIFSYLGKSTGDGALAIWTHHLNDIDFLDYHSAYYTGKAIRMGAGAAADKEGLNVAGGECPTVGLAGPCIIAYTDFHL